MEIKILRSGDELVLSNVADGVFDNPIDPKLTEEFLADARHHLAVCVDRGVVIAFASALHYVHPDKPAQMWINEIAVAPPYRRRGIGKALLRCLFSVGQSHRCTVAWVLTDRTNAAAMSLYKSMGGSEGADDEGPSDCTLGYSFELQGAIG